MAPSSILCRCGLAFTCQLQDNFEDSSPCLRLNLRIFIALLSIDRNCLHATFAHRIISNILFTLSSYQSFLSIDARARSMFGPFAWRLLALLRAMQLRELNSHSQVRPPAGGVG
jgi:hypothetical protein